MLSFRSFCDFYSREQQIKSCNCVFFQPNKTRQILFSSVIVLLKGRYCFRAIFYAYLYTIILPVSTIFYDGKHLGQKKKVTKNCEKKLIYVESAT